MKDLEQLTAWASAFLAKLDPAARRTLLRAVATDMRRRQAARIAEQHNSDGTPYVPRKPQLRHKPGRVRRAMFIRLRTTRFLKTEADANAAAVTFLGRVQRITKVHQFGLRDRVNKAGLQVQYAQRELLGFSEGDIARLVDLAVAYITP
ncbi:virion morphogenesis protein [Cupriavidus sp. UYMSc13B]|nr:virion morphogenesis protein [Cupriavidus sp. UYMSc13B]